ncbi:diiron oxygenase [Acidiferrobacter sp.]|uniref:diiron oxygenase n=1 Tax=Acidiferrobacter sp. TaxID=1872107 RepID=UPI002608339A|nr:diiron oxygenase [Acidiferrobacter sp.]
MANPDLLKSSSAFAERATQLSRHSTPYRDPVARIHWERLSHDAFWLPQQAVSLYGIEEYEALPLPMRQALSHHEFARFLSAGIWLESVFLQRLARAALKGPRATRIYHIHELREEAGHSLMFLEFFERAGLPDSATDARFDPWLTWLGRRLPFRSTLFWSAILLGEEIPDRLNRYVRLHAQGVCPVAVELSVLHSTDEARHIAYGQEILRHRLERAGGMTKRLLGYALSQLLRRFVATFYYPPQDLYIRAGLPDEPWAARAARHALRRQFVDHCLGPTVSRLRELGLTIGWP